MERNIKTVMFLAITSLVVGVVAFLAQKTSIGAVDSQVRVGLQNKKFSQSMEALSTLLDTDSDETVESIVKSLDDPDPSIRCRAASFLPGLPSSFN